ncbi:MAG: Nramp family divalent metal transporter [Candidatus Riflebacteria bacterium]|nr:Nramp family divalent metal transporter [Candidatus Riflebacteria bacterium]
MIDPAGPEGSFPSVIEPAAGDRKTVAVAVEILAGGSEQTGFARFLPFMGPAFIASVAYIDPGNFATNLQGGAQFGYMLTWVVIASNLMAMLIQSLSAKLGIATGKNLAELCREEYSLSVVWVMWVLMEIVAMATDLAEFLGAALGFNLLFGMPLWLAGIMTAIATFLILGLERYGFRPLEAVITGIIGVISVCYLFEIFLAKPDWIKIAWSIAVPRLSGSGSILLATGILGATVMPHVIFLHSALMQGRIVTHKPEQMKKLFRYEVVDVVVAMGVAGAINAAMLIMAAKTFHEAGIVNVDAIEKAHLTLEPLLGKSASVVFAISLLAAGLSSSAVGTMAGQIIMQGFIRHQIPIWVRRVVTMAPALIVIFLGLNPTRTLVMSQVLLSFGLPFAIIPLVRFTQREDLMGVLVNSRLTGVLAWGAACLIVILNLYLIFQTFSGAS